MPTDKKKICSVILLITVFFGLLNCVIPVKFFAEETGTNITQNEGVTVSATTSANTVCGLIDGDNTIATGAAADKKGAWSYSGSSRQTATVNLGGYYTIYEIRLYMGWIGGSNSPAEITLSYTQYEKDYTIENKMQPGEVYTYAPEQPIVASAVSLQTLADSGGVVRMREIEIYGVFHSDKGVNLARGNGVSVTSSGGQNADKLIDGDRTSYTGWSFYGKGASTLTIDLQDRYKLIDIDLYEGNTNLTHMPEKLEVLCSEDGINYYELISLDNPQTEYKKTFDETVIARYVRLYIPAAETERTVRIREAEIYGQLLESHNFTQNADVRVVSSLANDYSAKGVIDGDNANSEGLNASLGIPCAWSYTSREEQSVTIDLRESCNISNIKLYMGDINGDALPEGFVVFCSEDGQNYTSVYESGEPMEYLEISLGGEDGAMARYIRLTVPSAEQARRICIRELEVYGRDFVNYIDGARAEIVMPNEPTYVQNKADAKIDVIIRNTAKTAKYYRILWACDDVIDEGSEITGTAAADEETDVTIDISGVDKGKYDNFSVRIFLDNKLAVQTSKPVTIIEFVPQETPFSEYSRVGMNWHIDYYSTAYAGGDRSAENYNKLMQYMGIKNLRSVHRWAWLEAKKGERQLNKHDAIDNMVKQYGQNFSPYILGFGNENYYSEEPRTYSDIMETIDYQKDIAANILSKGIGINSFEIWNEPNMKSFWGSDRWTTYPQYANRLAFEMKKIYPEKDIVACAVAAAVTGPDYINAYLRRGGAVYADAISCHPYTYRVSPDETYYNRAAEFVNCRDNAGGWMDVYITEIGYPTHNNLGSNTAQYYGISDRLQAQYLPKYFIYNDELDVKLTDLYTFEDTGTDASYSENNYGLVDTNYVPKEGYVSMAQMNKYFAGSQYIGRFLIADNAYAYVYMSPKGLFAVTWSRVADKQYTHTLETGVSAEDLYGNPMPQTDGKITVGADPVYLLNVPVSYIARAAEEQLSQMTEEISGTYPTGVVNLTELQGIEETLAGDDILSAATLKNCIDMIYEYGLETIERYTKNSYDMEHMELAVLLSKLYRTAERLGAGYAYFDAEDSDDYTEAYDSAVNVISLKKGAESESSLLYTDAIMKYATRAKRKADEIAEKYSASESFAGKVGVCTAACIEAKNLAVWAETFAKLETPDISRAVFTYIEDTEPTYSAGEWAEFNVDIENLLTEKVVDGIVLLKNPDGTAVGSGVNCSIEPDECESCLVSGQIPYNIEDGVHTFYVDIEKDGNIIKRSEMSITIDGRTGSEAVGVNTLGLYNDSGIMADETDLAENAKLTVKSELVRLNDDELGKVAVIAAQYSNDTLINIKIIPVSDTLSDAELGSTAEVTEAITTVGGTDSIKLFVFDLDNIKCYTRILEVKNENE